VVVRAMLELLGYEVALARDGAQAISLYQEARADGRPFSAVIMDLVIPGGMGGKEAAQRLLRIDPGARLVVASGYSQDPVMSSFAEHGFAAVLAKPFDMDRLGDVLG